MTKGKRIVMYLPTGQTWDKGLAGTDVTIGDSAIGTVVEVRDKDGDNGIVIEWDPEIEVATIL